MRPLLFLLAAVAAVALSGCMGNAVTISGQGYKTGSESRTLSCGDHGHIALGIQGAGKMSVSVLDGAGKTVYSEGGASAGQDGSAQELHGQPGTWTLKVSTGFGYSGQYGITLSC
ncbi:MAG: hypothetical protein QOC71_713 [Thermoplasmata archaeon]|jgi:hypothetical protein|nr:hypothetical protein [Thermoplasmata archaeon]